MTARCGEMKGNATKIQATCAFRALIVVYGILAPLQALGAAYSGFEPCQTAITAQHSTAWRNIEIQCTFQSLCARIGSDAGLGACRLACGACTPCPSGDLECHNRNRRNAGYLELQVSARRGSPSSLVILSKSQRVVYPPWRSCQCSIWQTDPQSLHFCRMCLPIRNGSFDNQTAG